MANGKIVLYIEYVVSMDVKLKNKHFKPMNLYIKFVGLFSLIEC